MALKQFETGDSVVVARPNGKGRFQAEIRLRGGSVVADEPAEVGGDGVGPTPYELLSAGLAACTAMTLRLYAERKGWDIGGYEVEVAHSLVPGNPPRDRFTREIIFEAAPDEERRARLLEIADRCPVHQTLMRGFEIVTRLEGFPPGEHASGDPAGQHELDMEEACRD